MTQNSSPNARIDTWYKDAAAERSMGDSHAPIWRHLISLTPELDLSGKTVLDYGCNEGGFLRTLHTLRPFDWALGVDIADVSVQRANELKGNVPTRYLADTSLEGFDEVFDLAFSHEVIYLIPDITTHAAAIWNALKPGGVYYAITGCHSDNPAWEQWKSLIIEKTNTVAQDRSVTDYAVAFSAAGFKVSARRFEFDGFLPFTPSGWLPDFN